VLFQRLESPPQQKTYQDYKPYLRKDFRSRCAYCLIHEAHYGGLRNYHVDHFRPQKRFPNLVLTYTNLYYACSLCNIFKGETWPSPKQLKAGFKFGDPCKEDLYEKHFQIDKRDGSLRALTNIGQFTKDHLRLDRRQLRKHRQRQIEARQKCKELRAALLTPGLPIFWVVKAREAIDQVERELLEPLPPYEAPDLLP
jgi:hypothetical protein